MCQYNYAPRGSAVRGKSCYGSFLEQNSQELEQKSITPIYWWSQVLDSKQKNWHPNDHENYRSNLLVESGTTFEQNNKKIDHPRTGPGPDAAR